MRGQAEMAVREKAAEVVPFVVMVIMEGCTIALTIWAKTVMTDHGMSPFVFVVYTNSLTSLILLPYSLIFHRHTRPEEAVCITRGLVLWFFFLGLTGTTRLDLKNPSFPVKLLGTFITVVGAVFVTLYKSTALFHLEQYLFVFASMPE